MSPSMMSPASVAAIGDDEFDSFLSFLETPTTTKISVKTLAVSDKLSLPFATEELKAEKKSTVAVVSANKKQTKAKSDDEFDEFLSFLEKPTSVELEAKAKKISDGDVSLGSSFDSDFVALVNKKDMDAKVVVASSKKSVAVVVAKKSEDPLDDFLAYLDGGDVPAPKPVKVAPPPRSTSVRIAEPARVVAAAPAVARASSAKAVASSKPTIDPKNLPVDYFVTEGMKDAEARNRAMRELSESVRPIAITYFSKLGEEEAIAHRNSMRELSDENMSIATRHFNDLAEKSRMSLTAVGDAEPMPLAIAHFTLAEREITLAKRAEMAELKANPPPMPPGQEYFTMMDREIKAKKADEIRDLVENPPPPSAAHEHFTSLAEERRANLIAEAEAGGQEAAFAHFTAKANEEKALRQSVLEETPEISVATQHFNEVARLKEEGKSTRRLSGASVMEPPPEPVPIDYFVNLYKEEKEAKKASESRLDVDTMPVAQAHFTELGRTKSQRGSGMSAEIESMPLATAHFAKIDAEKEARRSIEPQAAEMMPIAIQRFTMAAREEKLMMQASFNDAEEGASIAHLHFTRGLSQRLSMAS